MPTSCWSSQQGVGVGVLGGDKGIKKSLLCLEWGAAAKHHDAVNKTVRACSMPEMLAGPAQFAAQIPGLFPMQKLAITLSGDILGVWVFISAEHILLGLYAGITPDYAQGTTCGVRYQTGVSHMQGQNCPFLYSKACILAPVLYI